MKILDRYLIKQFLQTTLFGLLAFILIFVIVDMMENLDDFIDHQVTAMIVLKYYVVFTPEIIRLMLPVAMLFAALFTTGKLSNLNEITAMKSSGISMYRFMAPLLGVSLLLCAFAVYFGGYVAPKANREKFAIEMGYLKKNISAFGNNLFFQDSKSRIVAMSYYADERKTAYKASIQEFDPKDVTRLALRGDAEQLVYDTLNNYWIAYNLTERHFLPLGEKLSYSSTRIMRHLNFRPKDLLIRQQKAEEMNLTELRAAIDNQERSGNDPVPMLIEYHSRYAFALTGFIVVLFGLPFSTNKRRGGMAIQVGVNILIAFVYMVMMKVVQAFGVNGSLDPLMTAWLVNGIFLFGALINLTRVKQ